MISFPAIPMAMPSRASTREVSLRPRALRAVAAEIRARARAAREPAPGAELIAVSPLAFRVRWQSPPRPEKMGAPDAPRVLRLHVTDGRGKPLATFDTYLPEDHGLRTVTIRHDRAWVRAEIGWLYPDGTLRDSVSSPRVAAIPLERYPPARGRPFPPPAPPPSPRGHSRLGPRARRARARKVRRRSGGASRAPGPAGGPDGMAADPPPRRAEGEPMKRRARPGLALILHAHLPWIRHEEHDDFLEERWLFEALRECYLPLLLMFERVASGGAPFRAAVSLSPTVRAMWADPLLQRRFARYMDAAIEFAQRQCHRLRDDARFHGPARHHLERARRTYAFWKNDCRENPLGRFVELQRAGVLELFTTSATHALLPLYRDVPEAVRAQIMIGADTFASDTGDTAPGFWLPECAYHPDLDPALAASGARYTVLDTHGLTLAHPAAGGGVFAPAVNARGFAFFARDPELTRRVWSAAEGYPGHPDYREFYRDLGHEVPERDLGRAAGPAGVRVDSGMKLWRVTGGHAEKQPYRRDEALARAREHASRGFL